MTRINNAKANSAWGKLSEKERQKALTALKSKFAERHEERIKAYAKTQSETDN